MLFIAGCGPQDMNAAQANGEVLNKDGMGPQGMGGPQGMAPQGDQAPQADEGCPTGQCGANAAPGASASCPTGNCEIAPDVDTHNRVQAPDRFKTEPTKIIPTNEDQVATHVTDIHTTEHIAQPTVRKHLVKKFDQYVRRHFLKRVYHPSYRRENFVVRNSAMRDEVMPTEEVVAPTVDLGCGGAPEPEPAPAPVVIQPVVRPVLYVQPVISYVRPYVYPMYY